MANECLDAILTASTADAADNTEVVEDGAADKAWEALSCEFECSRKEG
jgi:hypothetical protein